MSTWRASVVALLVLASLLTAPVAAAAAPASPTAATAVVPATSTAESSASVSLESATTDTPSPTPLSTHNELELTTALDRTPDRVGEITATVTAEIPSQFTELTLELPEGAQVVATSGFTRTADGNVAWDSNSNPATVTYRIDATVRSGADQPGAEGSYRFADTANWSLVQIPSVGDISGRIVGDDPRSSGKQPLRAPASPATGSRSSAPTSSGHRQPTANGSRSSFPKPPTSKLSHARSSSR